MVVDGRAARLGSGQRHVADYSGSLEPGGCFEAHFHLDVLRFGDVQVGSSRLSTSQDTNMASVGHKHSISIGISPVIHGCSGPV